MSDTGLLLIGLALGALALVMGLLLWRGARRWWRVWRYGAPIDHSTLLVAYGRKMTAAPDRRALAHLLTAELPDVLQAERSVLLMPEDHQLVGVDLADGEDGLHLSVSHAAVRWVASGGDARDSDRGRLRDLVRQGPSALNWTCVWVPLMRGGDLRGLWLLAAGRWSVTQRHAARSRSRQPPREPLLLDGSWFAVL